MGGHGSKPAANVEVRLEPPLNLDPPEGLYFIARLHSAAEGIAKYKVWGDPQAIGIWEDDVITVSIHAARTEAHFDRGRYEDVAELHLPWELVSQKMSPGQEVVFDFGLATKEPWLGHNELQGKYQHAFKRALGAATAAPTAPRIRIGLREVPDQLMPQQSVVRPPLNGVVQQPQSNGAHVREPASGSRSMPFTPGSFHDLGHIPSQAASPLGHTPSPAPRSVNSSSPAPVNLWPNPPPPRVLSSMHDLDSTPAAMSQSQFQIHQLEVRNRELRGQLGLREDPNVDFQADQAARALGQAAAENDRLRAETSGMERELAAVCGELAALGGQAGGAQGEAGGVEERHCAALMAEIQAVINQNNDLSSRCDGEILALEDQLCRARSQWRPDNDMPALPDADMDRIQVENELHSVLAECRELETYVQNASAEALAMKAGAEDSRCRWLQQESSQRREEIDDIKRRLREVPYMGTQDFSMPGTTVLRAEVDHLREKLMDEQKRRHREQEDIEQRPDGLRREITSLQDALRETVGLLRVAENELQELQLAHERYVSNARSSAAERARSARLREEKELIRDALAKDTARSKKRIGILDTKIQALQAEAVDLAERAGLSRRPEGTISEGAVSGGLSRRSRSSQGDLDAARLEELVRSHEQSLQSSTQEQSELQAELETAQRDLDSASLEVRLAEHRVRLFRRSGLVAPSTGVLSSAK